MDQESKPGLNGRPHGFFFGAALFVGALLFTLLEAFSSLPHLANYLAAWNATVFLLCGYDKSIAGSSAMRVPEVILIIFSLLGGSIGLLLGMNFFRHKTRKASFQLKVLVILLIQILVLRDSGFGLVQHVAGP